VKPTTDRELEDFEWLIDLAQKRLGGRAIACSDEFFAPKENLLEPGRGVFIPDRYTENGKWMDGWESRRKRTPGHDWCILKLGLPGVVRGIDADTNHFLGNAPESVSLEGIRLPGYRRAEELSGADVPWTEILPRTKVQPGSPNPIRVAGAGGPWTHLRLHIYPDGGVARFRVYGDVAPDWVQIAREHRVVDLAAVEHGGLVVAASDSFFSDRRNLIMPGGPTHMGDGWETKRRRGPGYDWALVRLGRVGRVERVEVDTTHFKGNFPDSCSIEGALVEGAAAIEGASWKPLLAQTKLEAHTRHFFELAAVGPISHVRLNIFPDGGVARLRVFGPVEGAA
jgi:allantoicase